MPKFLNRFQLTEELEKIISEAKESLILISPYFKLNDLIIKALEKHKLKNKFSLIIVYGKNEENKQKSLSDSDLDFFKSFNNVEIRYHKRLHAKIYVNEYNCLLTSMNLHDFSMKENIEFGILTKSSFLPGSLDSEAYQFCEYIVEKSQIEFKKEVQKKKSFFGLFTKYGNAVVEVEEKRNGYCLRYGTRIQYNPAHPYSIEAYHSWNQYKNFDYIEKYCHSCGCQYKTTMCRPLCNDCYNKN
jgi:hypothetical protein